jgi:hypothetical protein
VVPGKKVYLFLGPGGHLRDLLIQQAVAQSDFVRSLRPPLSSSDLSFSTGLEQTQTTVIRGTEDMKSSDWEVVAGYLDGRKPPGQSLILSGELVPELPEAKKAKNKIQGQGIMVDTTPPGGEIGRKDLVQWVLEEWKVTIDVARQACSRAGYSPEALVWATPVWKTLSGGRPVVGYQAPKMVELVLPATDEESVYGLILTRHRMTAWEAAKTLPPESILGLLRRLEAAVTDLGRLHSVLGDGRLSAKILSNRSGVHIVRTLELMSLASHYSPASVAQCRQALQIGFDNHRQPEVAALTALIWG